MSRSLALLNATIVYFQSGGGAALLAGAATSNPATTRITSDTTERPVRFVGITDEVCMTAGPPWVTSVGGRAGSLPKSIRLVVTAGRRQGRPLASRHGTWSAFRAVRQRGSGTSGRARRRRQTRRCGRGHRGDGPIRVLVRHGQGVGSDPVRPLQHG